MSPDPTASVGDTALDPSDVTVSVLLDYASSVTDPAELARLYALEYDDRGRVTALEGLAAREIELGREGDSSG